MTGTSGWAAAAATAQRLKAGPCGGLCSCGGSTLCAKILYPVKACCLLVPPPSDVNSKDKLRHAWPAAIMTRRQPAQQHEADMGARFGGMRGVCTKQPHGIARAAAWSAASPEHR